MPATSSLIQCWSDFRVNIKAEGSIVWAYVYIHTKCKARRLFSYKAAQVDWDENYVILITYYYGIVTEEGKFIGLLNRYRKMTNYLICT